ncbi:MAG TPA: tetratricopeptide repeat protein [Myxococcota bacterium]|jgi:tetratricopeptide (TPR) repeat protein|nr:tetratricopeptide repeat protein [Myxococcota bacterium]
MSRLAAALAGLLLVASVLAGCPNELELKRKSETRYKIADDAYARGDYATALVELERAIDLYEKNAEAHHLMGLYFMIQRSDFANAEKELKKAIAYHDGPYSKAKNALGNLYLNAGRVDEAIPLFEDALSDIHYYKESWAAEANLGRALFAKGELDGALTHLDRAVGINPRFCAAYFYRGDVHAKKGDLEHAARDYGWATTKDETCRGFTDAFRKLGNTYLGMTSPKKAEAAAAFAGCVASAPESPIAGECSEKLRVLCIDESVRATAACTGTK